MNEFQIISILLVVLVLIDAIGDAFRLRKRQILHHTLEVCMIAGFFALWALFSFKWEYLLMYVLGRIILFDIAFNLVAGNKLTYTDSSSIYGRVLTWFSNLIKEPGQLIWVLRGMALITWLSFFFTK